MNYRGDGMPIYSTLRHRDLADKIKKESEDAADLGLRFIPYDYESITDRRGELKRVFYDEGKGEGRRDVRLRISDVEEIKYPSGAPEVLVTRVRHPIGLTNMLVEGVCSSVESEGECLERFRENTEGFGVVRIVSRVEDRSRVKAIEYRYVDMPPPEMIGELLKTIITIHESNRLVETELDDLEMRTETVDAYRKAIYRGGGEKPPREYVELLSKVFNTEFKGETMSGLAKDVFARIGGLLAEDLREYGVEKPINPEVFDLNMKYKGERVEVAV